MEDEAEARPPEQDVKKILTFVDDNLNYALVAVYIGSVIFMTVQENKEDKYGPAFLAFLSVMIFYMRNCTGRFGPPLPEKRERQVQMLFNILIVPTIVGIVAYMILVIILNL